jgi:hypothetical protein
MKPTIYSILSRGYFPRELPPAFTTVKFGRVINNNKGILPQEFNNKKPSKMLNHNLLARGTLRRRLGIPNPRNYYQLSDFIVDHWDFLKEIVSKSKISLTNPVPVKGIRAIDSKVRLFQNLLDERKTKIRNNSRYLLVTDINQCYHSIYTHSIAWAIHTKTTSKAQRNNRNLLGNTLDLLVRNCNDQQTVGIPIGPDSSFLIAEIILNSIDKKLIGRGYTNAYRQIDDFEFGCKTSSEAESIRDYLIEILEEYDLTLNTNKTEIVELPIPFESFWISQLRASKINHWNSSLQKSDLLYYFGLTFKLYKEYGNEPVIKYAVQKLRGTNIYQTNWVITENFLLQCAITDPSAIDAVLNLFLKYRGQGHNLHFNNIGEVLNEIISIHSSLKHDSEVAWALWGLLVLKLKIRPVSAKKASEMDDSIVAILLLDANTKKLVPRGIKFDVYESFMTTYDLYGEQWLLAYEANVKNWLPSKTIKDHVKNDACFSFLKTKGVYFYDDNMSTKVEYKPIRKLRLRGGGGGGGWGGGY